MKKFWIVVMTIILGGIAGHSPLQAETVDKVVAVVNEEPITLFELQNSMAKNREKIRNIMGEKAALEASKDLRNLALKILIDEKLLDQELAKKNIVITPSDEEKAMQNILERNQLDMAGLKKELAKKGQNLEEYKENIREQLKKIKFMGQVIAPSVRVTDADLDEFFAKNPEQFAQFQSVKIAQVIIKLSPTADDAQLAEAKKTAEEVRKKAARGADFEELGEKYSVNPQTAVPDIYPVTQLAPQIINALGNLKPGEVGEPVRSGMGLHVIKLYERSTMAGEEFRAIREQLREKVFEVKVEEALHEYLEDVKSKSFIEIKT